MQILLLAFPLLLEIKTNTNTNAIANENANINDYCVACIPLF